MTLRPELIDELLKDCSDPREVLAEGGLIKQLTKAIIERCLESELDAHLGYPKHGRREEGSANARNGSSRKTLKGAQGEIEITVPRDRQARADYSRPRNSIWTWNFHVFIGDMRV